MSEELILLEESPDHLRADRVTGGADRLDRGQCGHQVREVLLTHDVLAAPVSGQETLTHAALEREQDSVIYRDSVDTR